MTTATQDIQTPVLLTRAEVAERLRCRPCTVGNLHRFGLLRGARVGRELRWTTAALEKYLRTQFGEGDA